KRFLDQRWHDNQLADLIEVARVRRVRHYEDIAAAKVQARGVEPVGLGSPLHHEKWDVRAPPAQLVSDASKEKDTLVGLWVHESDIAALHTLAANPFPFPRPRKRRRVQIQRLAVVLLGKA